MRLRKNRINKTTEKYILDFIEDRKMNAVEMVKAKHYLYAQQMLGEIQGAEAVARDVGIKTNFREIMRFVGDYGKIIAENIGKDAMLSEQCVTFADMPKEGEF